MASPKQGCRWQFLLQKTAPYPNQPNQQQPNEGQWDLYHNLCYVNDVPLEQQWKKYVWPEAKKISSFSFCFCDLMKRHILN